jgi:hypothetical protein
MPGRPVPDVELSIGRLTSAYNTLDALSQRIVVRSLNGLEPAADGAVMKLVNSQVTVQAGDFGVLCAGPSAAADGPAAAPLATPRVLIGGGTVEMQLNMIGERILGLPRT